MTDFVNVADIVEENGKTIRQNNRARIHKIPLKTLVEILVEEDDDYCMDKYRGVRAYVSRHERDCDGTPLYGLTIDRDFIDENAELLDIPNTASDLDKTLRSLARAEISSGYSEESLKVINPYKTWPQVPPQGTYVVADHPITCANPSLIFRVFDVKSEKGKIYARGLKTIWFHVEMLRPPTKDEAADLNNYCAEDL